MGTPGPILMRLEIEREGERIAGRLSTEWGLTVPFTGWLGLAAAIEQATTAGGPPALEGDRDEGER